MDEQPPRPTLHFGALLSFVLGLSSVALCLTGLTGVPALLFGLRSLRAVNASGGRLAGAWLAVGGMVLGGLGTLAMLGGIVALILLQLQVRAARLNCQDNLRRVGFALAQHENATKTLPRAVLGPRHAPPERQLAWTCDVVALLGSAPDPRLSKKKQQAIDERFEAIAALLDRDKPWDDEANARAVGTTVAQWRCPVSADRAPGLTNYVGIAGVGPGAATLPREDGRAGAFGFSRGVALGEMKAGTSYVIVAMETTNDLGPWCAGGSPTLRELAAGETHYVGPGRPFGGLHEGMTNVLWADGSVRPVSERMPGDVLRQHATLRGGK